MIDLIIYDFDGVMTNNKVIIDQSGNESVIVNRSDGLAISEFRRREIKQIIISTEKNSVVQRRAEKLKIPCVNAVEDKKTVVEEYFKEHSIDRTKVVYLGNDINDLEVMKVVGYPVAPADAHDSIRLISKFVTSCNGGDGVVRELLDILIIEDLI
ncbi:MAG: HAD hydrolase family protein [Bacteroidales bacterium]|jgi:YrbI family 3-deoxy-D-manno-octulosonate 8-phosphate phosphatase|nr:HAD hydrolase family protein [Bacteroidales bacterium]